MIYFVLFLCGSKIPKHFNKLFSDHKHSERLYCMLRLGKRSICPFEEQVSPTKRKTINEKHQEGRRRVKEWICKTGEQRTFYFLGLTFTQTLTPLMEGLFYALSFCLVYLARMMQNKPRMKQGTKLLYTQLFQLTSISRNNTLYPGSQRFPNSENPTLLCNITWNITKGTHCIPLKFSPIHSHYKYKANRKPN